MSNPAESPVRETDKDISQERRQALIAFILGGVVVVTLTTTVVLALIFLGSMRDNEESSADDSVQIDSFADCVAAGNPVQESFPRVCTSEDGSTFVEEVEPENGEYYGSSTLAECSQNSDCQVGGCNAEICGSEADARDSVSVCILPEQPLPQDLGYSCSCVQNQCQWAQ
jgi:eight-cysteine-cluster-containing protein